jgi:hypothetical protein
MSNTKDNKQVTTRMVRKAVQMLFQLPILSANMKPSYSVQDIRALQKNLRDIQPELRRQFVRDIKKIGKEAQGPIVQAIKRVTPLSGMRFNYGRLGWGRGVAADKTKVQFRTQAGGKSLTTSLVRVRLESPAATIADMAGRSGRSIGKGYQGSGRTRPYMRRMRNGEVQEITRRTSATAGREFVDNLNSMAGVTKGSASRMAWPSVEKNLPNIEKRIDDIVRDYYKIANRKFS